MKFKCTQSKFKKRQSTSVSMDPVEVFARIKPINAENDVENKHCIKSVSEKILHLVSATNKITECHFDHLFDEKVSQFEIFRFVAKPMVEDLLIGKSGLFFTYGVTSSGKTYTMMGDQNEPGLLIRSIDMLFNSIRSVQALQYTFLPDDLNGYNVQSEAYALSQKKEQDLLTNDSSKTKQIKRSVSDVNVAEQCVTEAINEDCCYAVFLTFVEIYNDYIYDLLSEVHFDSFNKPKQPQSKRLREDKHRNMFVYGVTQIEVRDAKEAIAAVQQGQDRRRIAQTQLNAESSRSHSIFTIRVVQAPLDPLGEDILQEKSLICVSQLALVDLAGSERLKRTGAGGDRLREAGNINSSLMTLRRCFEQLRENQKSKLNQMVKYRNSKLTHLFKSFFEGHGKVKMVVCLNPSAEEHDENLQVVQFAELAQQVEVASSQQLKLDYNSVKKKAAEIRKKQDDLRKLQLTATWQLSLDKFDPINKNLGCKSKQSDDNQVIWESVGSSYSDFPNSGVLDCADDETLVNIIEFLENRIASTNKIINSVSEMENLYKTNLEIQLKSEENVKCKFKKYGCELKQRSKNIDKLENQIRKLESKNQVLIKSVQVSGQNKKQLQTQLDVTEAQLKVSNFENRLVSSKLKVAVENTRTQIEKQCEKKVHHIQTELKSQILKKEEHL